MLPHAASLAWYLVEFRIDFTMKLPPGIEELTAELAYPAAREAEPFRDFHVLQPDGQGFCDATFRLGLAVQPGGKVTSERSLLGDRCAVVLDHRLNPFAFLLIEAIQTLDNDCRLLLSLRRVDIPHALASPDASAVISLCYGKTGQDGWVGNIRLAKVNETLVRDAGVGNYLLHRVVVTVTVQVTETYVRDLPNGRQHPQEIPVPCWQPFHTHLR